MNWPLYSGVCSFCWNFTERQILWSLCSVDFHTLKLQLPIQTPHSVAPELEVFVSSLQKCQKFRKTSTPQYIFFYLFKLTWIETHGTDHLFLFTHENQLLRNMAFFLIFIIYLFSYWKWCQQKHVELLQMNPLDNLRYFYNVLIKWNLLLKNIFLHHCDGNVSKTRTKRKLKSTWNWEFDCESKKSTEHKLHKIWCSHIFL